MSTTLIIIIATILWGIWGIADKKAVGYSHPYTVQWMYALTSIVLIPVWYFLGAKVQPETNHHPGTFWWAIGGSVLSAVAHLLMLFAMSKQPASIVAALTSAYPLVTLLIAVIIRTEELSLPKVGGMLLVVAGLVIMQGIGN